MSNTDTAAATFTTDDIAGIATAIANDEGYTVTAAPAGIAIHIDNRNLGIITAAGHSVSLHFTSNTGPGRTIRDFTNPVAALAAVLDFLYR